MNLLITFVILNAVVIAALAFNVPPPPKQSGKGSSHGSPEHSDASKDASHGKDGLHAKGPSKGGPAKGGSHAEDDHSGQAKEEGSNSGPPPPAPREPKPRPDEDDLDFKLRCPPEQSFRLIPYILIDDQQTSSSTSTIASINIQSGPPAKGQPPPPVYNWGPQPGRFPSNKQAELHSTWKQCIFWDAGKQPNSSNQKEKLLEAFWAWLGLTDCSTSTTSTDSDTDTSNTATTGSGSGALILSDLPMMDTVGLVTSCTLRTQIVDKITGFTDPKELEKYWRTLFKENDK